MNVSTVKTKDYENKRLYRRRQNKPKQSQFKPNLRNAKMNVTSVKTKDYRNEPRLWLRENKPNSNPKQTQFQRQERKTEKGPAYPKEKAGNDKGLPAFTSIKLRTKGLKSATFISPIQISNVTIKKPSSQTVINRYPCCVRPAGTTNRTPLISQTTICIAGAIVRHSCRAQSPARFVKRNRLNNSAGNSFYHFITPPTKNYISKFELPIQEKTISSRIANTIFLYLSRHC